MRIKLDRTVCDGFGICAARAPQVFDLDEWGYPTLRGSDEIAEADQDDVRRALLDCPAHAIIVLDAQGRPDMAAGGEAATSRSYGPDALWDREGEQVVASGNY